MNDLLIFYDTICKELDEMPGDKNTLEQIRKMIDKTMSILIQQYIIGKPEVY